MNFVLAIEEDLGVSGNSDGSFDPDNWLQDLQLEEEWITSIDPNLTSQQTSAQTLALSTIPDVPVTPDGPDG